MNRAELIQAVSEKTGLVREDAGKAVDAVLAGLTQALAAGKRVQIPGFGSFEVREYPEREVRNPATGEKVLVPAAKSPVFKPGKRLKDTVNQ